VSKHFPRSRSTILRTSRYPSESVHLILVISQPVLILVVGSAGLASNIVGLVLFHDHGHGGHSHGAESNGHSHSHTGDIESGEHSHDSTRPTSSSSQEIRPTDDGDISEILPESVVRRASLHNARPRTNTVDRSPSKKKAKRTSRQSFASADDIYVSPAANRQFIMNQAQEIQSGYAEESSDSGEDGYNGDTTIPTSAPSHNHKRSASIPHEHHNHAKPKQPGEGGGHSHQNLNMRGVFLHVLGDALGNIGVIATALFIWLTDFSWRFYSDPVISLVITAIIFSSALPLVKSASLILLQGVPRGISLDDVKEDILQVLLTLGCVNDRSMELIMSMNYIFGNYLMSK
jgi:solute carrier family 30 (zinc transporter), member 1